LRKYWDTNYQVNYAFISLGTTQKPICAVMSVSINEPVRNTQILTLAIRHHTATRMTFPNQMLSQATWQRVGLGTTALVFGLGAFAMLARAAARESLGPTGLATEEGRAMNVKAIQFLGIRNIAVGAALFWFHQEKNSRAMGVIFSAWTLVRVTDTWIAAHGPRGFDNGILGLCGGALMMAFVGLGLFQS